MSPPLRVLIVEDSEDDVLLLLRELRRGGYQPAHERVETPEGMEAALEKGMWDLVVSDHSMPHFNSSAALKMLREKGYPDLPFIIVSGRIGEDVAVEAMKAGAQDYIMKDNLARLTSAIERELREAEGRRERRRAEEALREAEEKYRGIFENAVEGIFQTTVDGRLLTANPAMARILGYESPEELLEGVENVAEQLYADPEHREKFRRLMQAQGYVSGFETGMSCKAGGTVSVSLAARALYDSSGGLAGYEGIMEDISERKRAEGAMREIREAERRRIARDLHDVVLQDLTYTLQSMQISRRLSQNGESNAEQEQQIEALRRAVGGLRDAIYDLRIEGVRDQSLLRSLESLVELNRQMVTGCKIDLVVKDSFPKSLAGTAGIEVIRTIQEALANVRQHSDACSVSIVLEGGAGEIRAEVRDDGRGFDPGLTSGTGLTGMRERITALGGKLEVESEPGSGTRVRLRVGLSVLAGGKTDLPGV